MKCAFSLICLILLTSNQKLIWAQFSDAESDSAQPFSSTNYPQESVQADEFGILDVGEPNWEFYIQHYPVKLVSFTIPWCKHCKEFGPVYDQLATRIRDLVPGIGIAKIDVAHWSGIKKDQDVKQVPTLRLFWADNKTSTYDGARETDHLLQWIVESLRDQDITLNLQALDEQLEFGSYPIAGAAAALFLIIVLGCCSRRKSDDTKKEK